MFARFIDDLKKHYKYALYSARAQLKSEVAGSYLNWIWWILEPFCFMIIYAIVFGVIFGAKEQYFTAFIFIGITVWDFFNRNVRQSVKLVKSNKAIVTKVYMPKFILILSKMFVNGFKMLISFAIVVFLMIVLRVPVTFNVIYLVPLLIDLWLITFGCMCFLTHFGVFVEDLANVTDIFLKFVFYMTGVMYSIEHRIGGKYPVIAFVLGKCNPIAYIISSTRDCLLYSSTPGRKLILLWFAISVLICALGIRLIYKNENSYAKVI